MPMNPEVKAKWLTALRSGKYQQGRGALRSADDRYCCLGVLCDLHAETEDGSKWLKPCGPLRDFSYQNSESMPPGLVMYWAALTGADCDRVAVLNDSGRHFQEIAEWIEGNL